MLFRSGGTPQPYLDIPLLGERKPDHTVHDQVGHADHENGGLNVDRHELTLASRDAGISDGWALGPLRHRAPLSYPLREHRPQSAAHARWRRALP